MREILFRGKAKNSGEWVEGDLVRLKDGETVSWYIYGKAEVIPETVGQYTQLTDKNGKKIFEGDIVKTDKFNTPNKKYIIAFDLQLGAFIGEDDGTMYFTTFDGDSELFEVIGNIHDNPELLEAKE